MQSLAKLFSDFTPIDNPVIVFAIVVIIILVTPYFSKKLKFPAIFGLIISGLVIGPNGTGLIADNMGVKILSSVGVLYLMFLAGLEINMVSFQKSKYRSIAFGILTFFIPLMMGYFVLRNLFDLPFHSSLLLASMFSTHTLVSYPVVNKLNITKRESVIITIGGTIITDTAVLLLLTIIVASFQGKLDLFFWLKLAFSLSLFIFLVLWGVPKLCRWFFKNVQADDSAQYLFVLVIFLISSLLAKVAGVEAIVGAFLSGLALNRVIPHNSALMNRIVFIGNTLFIPFFLIGVGMLINIRVLFAGFDTILFAFVMIVVALTSKYIAAFLTQVFFRYPKNDRNLIFGLSASHAAATIAVILIGYEIHLVNETALNATILLILVSCSVSSFVTEDSGRKIVLHEPDDSPDVQKSNQDNILVPIANTTTVNSLIDFALLARQDNTSIVYPLSIVQDDEHVEESLQQNKSFVARITGKLDQQYTDVRPLARIDINIPTGIYRTMKELRIKKLILGWSGKTNTANYFFGNIVENLLENCRQLVIVTKFSLPLNLAKNIYLFLPAHAEKEQGFMQIMNTIKNISHALKAKIIIVVNSQSQKQIRKILSADRHFGDNRYMIFEYYPNISSISEGIPANDLIIAVSARPYTVSFNRRLELLPKILSRHFSEQNYAIFYPEQSEDTEAE
jgi:Kef-type K+ transport system membrane component KefB